MAAASVTQGAHSSWHTGPKQAPSVSARGSGASQTPSGTSRWISQDGAQSLRASRAALTREAGSRARPRETASCCRQTKAAAAHAHRRARSSGTSGASASRARASETTSRTSESTFAQVLSRRAPTSGTAVVSSKHNNEGAVATAPPRGTNVSAKSAPAARARAFARAPIEPTRARTTPARETARRRVRTPGAALAVVAKRAAV